MTRVSQLLKHALLAELAVFGVVGIVCLVADIVLFNAFVFGIGMNPVVGKALGLVITGVMAFYGHRHITFRSRRRRARVRREVGRFFAATAATVLLSLLPLFIARHVAGVTSVVGLNIANIVGIAMGTAVRYLAYRYLVWGAAASEGEDPNESSEAKRRALVA